MTRQKLIEYCLTMPLSYEDYPFDDVTDAGTWTVMRHQVNPKSFALIYEQNGKLCVNLKCNPFEADFFRQLYQNLTPAYHMNKQHWNTVTLGGDVPEDELLKMIVQNYGLIKPKTGKAGGIAMIGERVYKMKFSGVYPLLVAKAEKKGRAKEEVDKLIYWLTGYDESGLKSQLEKEADYKTFFAEAPQMNPNCNKITGVVCGIRVEEIWHLRQ